MWSSEVISSNNIPNNRIHNNLVDSNKINSTSNSNQLDLINKLIFLIISKINPISNRIKVEEPRVSNGISMINQLLHITNNHIKLQLYLKVKYKLINQDRRDLLVLKYLIQLLLQISAIMNTMLCL